MYCIRIGDANDIPSLTIIWRRSVIMSHEFLTSADIDALEPEVRTGLATLELWVAEDAGQAVGFMAMNGDIIEALFIDQDHRGKKVGSSFIEHAQAIRGKGTRLRLDVNEQNTAALGFYEALGFAVVGRSDTDSAGRPWPLLHMLREER